MRALALILLLAACAVPRVETGRTGSEIYYHPGGLLRDVPPRMLRLPGPVRVSGQCDSACTAVLARPDVCTTPDAVWRFHGAQQGRLYAGNAEWDAQMAAWYRTRPGLTEWFYGGDLAHFRTLTGAQMARFGVPLCD